jgi:hypothetical protein
MITLDEIKMKTREPKIPQTLAEIDRRIRQAIFCGLANEIPKNELISAKICNLPKK